MSKDSEARVILSGTPLYETRTDSAGTHNTHIHYVYDSEHERLITCSLKKHADIWEDLSRR